MRGPGRAPPAQVIINAAVTDLPCITGSDFGRVKAKRDTRSVYLSRSASIFQAVAFWAGASPEPGTTARKDAATHSNASGNIGLLPSIGFPPRSATGPLAYDAAD